MARLNLAIAYLCVIIPLPHPPPKIPFLINRNPSVWPCRKGGRNNVQIDT